MPTPTAPRPGKPHVDRNPQRPEGTPRASKSKRIALAAMCAGVAALAGVWLMLLAPRSEVKEAYFAAARALEREDAKAWIECWAPDERGEMAWSTIQGWIRTKGRKETEERLGTLGVPQECIDLAIKDGGKGHRREGGEALQAKFPDVPAFYAALVKAMPKDFKDLYLGASRKTFFLEADVRKIDVDGDEATLYVWIINSGAPFWFRRIDGRWYLTLRVSPPE